jgi:hypothetical protein
MVNRCIDPESIPVLVDLGYVNDKASRDFADRLMAAGISPKRFSIEAFGRLLVNLPPTKAGKIIKRFRLREGSTYFMCTHHRAAIAKASGK